MTAIRPMTGDGSPPVEGAYPQPALTVIITGIFDEAWLVEIEAVAAA